jgi:hypothetical protein
VTFCNMLVLHVEDFTPRNAQSGIQSLGDCLFSIFSATLHT